jgi:hypothetical protein
MFKQVRFALSPLLLIGASAMSMQSVASDKCSCSDGHGAPQAATGLGQQYPQATDLAADPAWQVYEFERDGIRYLQINDASGQVRAATGRIGGTFWVMPIGSDADRVGVDGRTPLVANARVLYRSSDTEVVLTEVNGQSYWIIRGTAAEY